MSAHGLIFNIQKFSLHDGPGIRTTVFLKGCPLDCWWCHNIESQRAEREPMLRGDLCTGCGACVERCPEQAIRLEGGRAETDLERCRRCGSCEVVCPPNGRAMCGTEMSVAEVLTEVCKDQVFYAQSGGGVTFSGGEPLAQVDFLAAALAACRAAGLHTAVDTSGYAPWEHLARILPVTDLFLYDLKCIDEATHRTFTGVSNRPILENLTRLAGATERIDIRIPVIPSVNEDAGQVARLIDFLHTIHFRQIHLIAYHELGRGKAAQLGRAYRMAEVLPPTPERLALLQERFAAAGFHVVTGD